MIAAGKAGQKQGPIPPLLWKRQHASQPGWSEFDHIPYREFITMVALENVYRVVEAYTSGKHSADIDAYYSRLIKDGIVKRSARWQKAS